MFSNKIFFRREGATLAPRYAQRSAGEARRPKDFSLRLRGLVALCFFIGMTLLAACGNTPTAEPTAAPTVQVTPSPTKTPARKPKNLPLADQPLKANIIAAGEYLLRYQLLNGELDYQVNFWTNDRAYSPVHVRLMGGTGALFTMCRVTGDAKYCKAGNLALNHYLQELVTDPKKFKGTCLYTEGYCQLGGAALTVDTIYKRWQAGEDFFLDDQNLLNTAIELGYFIVSMRKPEGGFYHAFDPHRGAVNPDYFAANSPGTSLVALLDLYEMTGNDFWLKQAREVNASMVKQAVTEDQWHSYAFSKFARLDALSKDDITYAKRIAELIKAGEVRSLNPRNASIATATKVEALAALAQAFYFAKQDHKQFKPDLHAFITFVQARQLPNNNCGWKISAQVTQTFNGAVFTACDDPSIRVDGLQNWINGLTAYLEYLGMGK